MSPPDTGQEHRILDAALRCFADRGYDATTLGEIVELAGVDAAALDEHFASKEAIAQRLYRQTMEAYSSALQEAARGDDPIERRLRRCWQAALALYRANPDAMTFAILRQHSFMPDLPPDFAYPIQIVESLIAEGQKSGAVRPGNPKLLAAIFSGCVLRPLTVARLVGDEGFALDEPGPNDETILDCGWAAMRR